MLSTFENKNITCFCTFYVVFALFMQDHQNCHILEFIALGAQDGYYKIIQNLAIFKVAIWKILKLSHAI